MLHTPSIHAAQSFSTCHLLLRSKSITPTPSRNTPIPESPETNRLESTEALSEAITSDSESPRSIVAHIFFLENFLGEKSYWKWSLGVKMSILGCLMLQPIFKYQHDFAWISVVLSCQLTTVCHRRYS